MRPLSESGWQAGISEEIRRLSTVRWSLLLLALSLAVIGVVTIHSAASELEQDYAARQTAWVALGIVAALLVFTVADYRALLKMAPTIYGLALVLLLAVLAFGKVGGGARRWLEFGTFHVQPSEVAKIATALLLARYLARVNQRYLGIRHLLVAGCIVLVPMALVVLEPDLGGAIMFLPMLAGALLVAGVRLRTLAVLTVIVLILGGSAWSFGMKSYQRQRVLTFLSPEEDPLGAGYQIRQSKIAVGSGGVLGQGYMQGTQSQLRFLPARHTDFIFAALAEERGFLGVSAVLLLYLFLFMDVAAVAVRSRDRAGILLVVALVSTLLFHVLYNLGMVIGLVPVTGIPLPFLSYGGSFTLTNFVSIGLILGVDFRRYVNR
jgi:rod shape determining protein RodA